MPLPFLRDPLPPVNPGERHIPVVLLIDISGSMQGASITELNQGLAEMGRALSEDPMAMGRAEICVISFNSSVQTEMTFRPAAEYVPPVVSASGLTCLNEAIEVGLDALESRKALYRANGIGYYRPWLFLLTDGAPTDPERESVAKERLSRAIKEGKVVFLPMGIGAGADLRKLQSYYPEGTKKRLVMKADARNFREAFVWLSSSVGVVSRSDPLTAGSVALPPTPSVITVGI